MAREITVKGSFNRAVIVNDTFVNGKDCVYIDDVNSKFSHAEGYKSMASGMYSHADGIKANAVDDNSYVWSGIDTSSTNPVSSNGTGTFSVYTSGYSSQTCSGEGLSNTFINGYSLSSIFGYYRDDAIDTVRNKDDIFTGNITLTSLNRNDEKKFRSGVNSTFEKSVTFNSTVTFGDDDVSYKTQPSSTNNARLATCEFVHTVIREYLKSILGNDVIKQ